VLPCRHALQGQAPTALQGPSLCEVTQHSGSRRVASWWWLSFPPYTDRARGGLSWYRCLLCSVVAGLARQAARCPAGGVPVVAGLEPELPTGQLERPVLRRQVGLDLLDHREEPSSGPPSHGQPRTLSAASVPSRWRWRLCLPCPFLPLQVRTLQEEWPAAAAAGFGPGGSCRGDWFLCSDAGQLTTLRTSEKQLLHLPNRQRW
jgi:hypothetical protein